MIAFVTAYDDATRANFAAYGPLREAADLLGAGATREALRSRLLAEPEAPLFAMTHGEERLLRGHEGEAALTTDDLAELGARAVYAWACHSASGLGRQATRVGATWWGYTGAISAPGTSPPEVEVFSALFGEIKGRFWRDHDAFLGEVHQRCELAAGALDAIAGSLESYLCLLHLWERLRVWVPGEQDAWKHPLAQPPTWMS